jgi:cysteine-rich repeat protein
MQASRLFIGLISMMITACTIWEPSVCPSGKQCPPGTRCAASENICIRDGCGDGVVEGRAEEECDDGNKMSDDGCSEACHWEICGNKFADPGEECDDGNTASGDGCSADCRSTEICGNFIVDFAADEMCDDGNKNPGDGCSDACLSEYCGNNITDIAQGEVCDDGNLASGDGCSEDCRSTEACGNGITDMAVGEVCDDAADISGDGCSSDCRSTEVCGNAITDTAVGEVCDDGTNVSGDGCSADCRSTEICGNGITDTAVGEVCDDGATISGDGCSEDCRSAEVCGNGITDTAKKEKCDDRNQLSGDGCSADCRSTEVCGNGIIDSIVGEVCDDGGVVPGDECSANCRSNEQCGNGITDTVRGELCDDGNRISGDGCDSDCRSTEVCPNGIPDVGEECDDGNAMPGDACSPSCRWERCGNGIVDPDEACDCGADAVAPGQGCEGRQNSISGGLCRPDCQFHCGDGVVNSEEQCDGEPVTNEFCTDYDSDMGLLGCDEDCRVTTATCQRFGWSEMESPTDNTLRDIWGTGPGNILAVGDGGVVIRFNGEFWAPMPSPASQPLKGIGGTSANDIWVVGERGPSPSGTIFHFDGSAWRDDAPTPTFPPLRSIWSHSPNIALAVGIVDTVRRFDGSAWTNLDCNSGGELNDVWGVSPSNIYAVSGNPLQRGICHYNGTSWSRDTSVPSALNSISGSGSNRIYAVGDAGNILQKNNIGSGWSSVGSPTSQQLNGVWVAPQGAQGGVFAVGESGTIVEGGGPTWVDASLPGVPSFFGVWGTHWNNVFAVGAGGQIWRRGATWTSIDLSEPDNAVLNDVTITSLGIYTVGNNGGIYLNGNLQTGLQDITEDLHGVWDGSGKFFVVGDGGKIYRETSARWEHVGPTVAPLKGIWGSANIKFVVGAAGTILRSTNTQGRDWSPMDSGTTQALNSVWGSSGNNVFAVGDNGTIRRFDGNDWTPIPSPTPDHLRSVWVSDDGDADDTDEVVFVLSRSTTSQSNQIWHRDGTTWTSMPLPPGTVGLQKLRGTKRNDIFAVGTSGQVLHYDGVAWAPIRTGTLSTFRGLWLTSDRVLVVGNSSYELLLPR